MIMRELILGFFELLVEGEVVLGKGIIWGFRGSFFIWGCV